MWLIAPGSRVCSNFVTAKQDDVVDVKMIAGTVSVPVS
jgi:hypothetical protein